MTSTREGVNPLRPYYIPPTIGIGEKNESTPPQPNPFSHANATTTTASSSSNSNAYATKARGIFQDIDYKDYINDSSPSTVQSVKSLVDELLWKYTSVLMAQPFEVAKTILQVRLQDDLGGLHIAPPFTPAAPNHRSKPSITSPKNPWSHSDNVNIDPAAGLVTLRSRVGRMNGLTEIYRNCNQRRRKRRRS